jgi:hypothetical protein
MSDLFWALYLAHLVGDYPLQTDWVFNAKRTWSGLWIHIAIHFVAMVVVMLPSLAVTWPYLVGLALLHYVLDGSKNVVTQAHPEWVIGPYLLDQFLHLLSIIAMAYLLTLTFPDTPMIWLERPWSVYLSGIVLVTFVSFITERLVTRAGSGYFAEIEAQKWSRMATRMVFFTLLVWIGQIVFGASTRAAGLLVPYVSTYGRRALLTDVVVSFAVAVLVLLAW